MCSSRAQRSARSGNVGEHAEINETAAGRAKLPAAYPMRYNYLALIQGGLGPDVWDRELKLLAADFRDAASQAAAQAEELRGQVVELSQNDWNVPIEGSLTGLRRTLSRLNERVHSGYDFNADPDPHDARSRRGAQMMHNND